MIGRLAYKTKDYYHTLLWLQEAYDKIQQESDPSYENLQEILDKLSFSLFKQGNVKRALLIAEELLKIGCRTFFFVNFPASIEKLSQLGVTSF